MTEDYYAALAAEVEKCEPKPAPRPGSAEFYFAQGVAAFLEGTPLSANPHKKHSFENGEWEYGWKIRQWGKSNEFHEYIKARTLYDQRYCPPNARGMLETFQATRQRKIARLEEAWPEFRTLYEKHQQRQKGY